MTDTAELIARLRQTARDFASNGIASEAADALSSLVRERDELRETNRKMNRDGQLARRGAYRDAKQYIRGLYAETTKRYLAIFHKTRRALQARPIEDMGVRIDELAERMTDRATAAEADAARMREALKPFAAAADDYDPDEGDDNDPAWNETFTIGALRRARNSLRRQQ